MAPTLHGSQQSRSPLVNWYAEEAGIPLESASSQPNNHPFGQVPFLTDDDGAVEVFESGAILLYLADRYGGESTPQSRAAYTKWVVYANATLDGLCFGAVPGDHRVRGACIGNMDVKGVRLLEGMLAEREWILDEGFSVADVAVGAYLNYVPVFFPQTNLSATPNIARYMKRCAERPAFSKAFGAQHAQGVAAMTAKALK